MRSTLCALLILAFASSAVPAQGTSGHGASGQAWAIGPRTLPPPANASAELRDLLAAESTPRLKLLHGEAPTELFVWPYLNTYFFQPIDFAGDLAKFTKTWHYVPENRIFALYVGN